MRRLLGLLALLVACSDLPTAPSPSDPSASKPVARPCLHTGFGYPRGLDELQKARAYGWEIARISVEHQDAAEANALILNAQAAGFEPLTIIRDAAQLAQLPSGLMYELRNEPDGIGNVPAAEYRALALDAAAVARQRGQTLYIVSLSNLHEDNFRYLRAVKPFPEGVRISVHRYGDGDFASPKGGFSSRDAEVKWLRAEIGDLPFAVTEFGYPDVDMPEERAAGFLREELEFWYGKADFACVYQIGDGPDRRRTLDTYGIFRLDGSPKPQATILQR